MAKGIISTLIEREGIVNMIIDEAGKGIYSITLNRPERKNAFEYPLLVALLQSLERASAEGSPIVVIRGSGGSFCSGGDLGEFRELSVKASPLGKAWKYSTSASCLYGSLMR